eukprot:NODE_579_length_5813_cov_0.453448.p2 type:complete len:352 gc:universal NODE_579_length_5813_cov_0.453448:4360-5415(+)
MQTVLSHCALHYINLELTVRQLKSIKPSQNIQSLKYNNLNLTVKYFPVEKSYFKWTDLTNIHTIIESNPSDPRSNAFASIQHEHGMKTTMLKFNVIPFYYISNLNGYFVMVEKEIQDVTTIAQFCNDYRFNALFDGCKMKILTNLDTIIKILKNYHSLEEEDFDFKEYMDLMSTNEVFLLDHHLNLVFNPKASQVLKYIYFWKTKDLLKNNSGAILEDYSRCFRPENSESLFDTEKNKSILRKYIIEIETYKIFSVSGVSQTSHLMNCELHHIKEKADLDKKIRKLEFDIGFEAKFNKYYFEICRKEKGKLEDKNKELDSKIQQLEKEDSKKKRKAEEHHDAFKKYKRVKQ